MFNDYQKLRALYLEQANRFLADGDIDACVSWLESSSQSLFGMLSLLKFSGKISNQTREEEINKNRQEFDTVKFCGAFRTNGRLIVINQCVIGEQEEQKNE